jgi:ATP-dependent RNA helicase RhlB
MELAYEHMNNPVSVSVTPEKMTAEGVEQTLFHVENADKFRGLLRILAAEKPERTIIFANTKGAVEMVARRLTANGYTAGVLSGDIPQKKRLRIVADFKEGKLQALVATDVASRGLHVPGISHVVNYDLPHDPEDYVHRIGRTARAGAEGKAYALVDEDSAFVLEPIENYIGNKIKVGWIDDFPDVEEKRAPRGPAPEHRRRGGPGGRDGGGRRQGQGGGRRDSRGGGGGGRRDGRGGDRRGPKPQATEPAVAAGEKKSDSSGE